MRVIGIPFAQDNRYKGVEKAPAAIVHELRSILSQYNISPVEYEEFCIGDRDTSETSDVFRHIEQAVSQVATGTIFLGGNHFITYPLVKGLVHPSFALVIFDAHLGSVHDFSLAAQESFVHALIREGILSPQQVFFVASHASYWDRKIFFEQKGIRCYSIETIFELGIQQVMDALTEQLFPYKSIYVSIDIDCLDPVFAPAIDYPEPSGLTSRELFYAVKRISMLKSFSYIDIIGLNPERDNGTTAWLIAKLLAGIRKG